MRSPRWWMTGVVACMLTLITSCAPVEPIPSRPIKRWVVYYDDDLPASSFKDYELVVFDRQRHPEFKPEANGTLFLAYVSIGETYHDDPALPGLKKSGAILFHNQTWNSYAVDLKSARWREQVMKQVGEAAAQGFHGVMLDTVDSPLSWAENQSSEQVRLMQEAAVSLIHSIRARYPTLKIMLNRGFPILPAVAEDINFALAESILAEKDNSSGQFKLFPPNTYTKAVAQLQQIVARAEHLQLFTLDYWDVGDVSGLERIYAMQRASGFIPYVTVQDLRHYTPEPIWRIPSHPDIQSKHDVH